MNVLTRPSSKFYELVPSSSGPKASGTVIFHKRILIGRLDHCDLTISDYSVSPIHAVVEILSNGGRVYDMNSEKGTKINGHKIICQDIKVGDKISFGKQDFIFKEYNKSNSLPPFLDALRPENREFYEKQKTATFSTSKAMPSRPRPTLPKEPPDLDQVSSGFEIDPKQIITDDSGEGAPYIAYPLAKDPKAEFSEYIFEDADDIYPIFKWSIEETAAEVIILHHNRILSVDYLPASKQAYHIKGLRKSNEDVEFPYLGRKQSMPFIEVGNGEVFVVDSLGYEGKLISDDVLESKDFKEKPIRVPVALRPQDILKLQQGNLQVFVRNTQAPPKIKPAPLLRRDNDSRKYFFIISILFILLMGLFSNVVINKEIEKEKQPERVATILYNRKKFTYKEPKIATPKKIKAVPRTPTKPKLSKPRPTPVKKTSPKSTPRPSKKIVKRSPVKRVSKIPAKSKVKKKGRPAKNIAKRNAAKKVGGRKSSRSSRTRRSSRPTKSKGHVDAYRPSHKFSGSLSKLLAKGGKVSGVQSEQISDADIGIGGAELGGSSKNIKRTKVAKNIGLLEGATTSKLDQTKGTEGLVNKKNIAVAGIPSRTVVLGDYDASVVSQILRQYLSQFRYCYQQELNRGSSISGMIYLHFNIGASGSVSKAGVAKKSDLPAVVEKCVVNVLRGIKFPPPLGGGVVAIRQPMSFEPRMN